MESAARANLHQALRIPPCPSAFLSEKLEGYSRGEEGTLTHSGLASALSYWG